jgi:hypothetical protein
MSPCHEFWLRKDLSHVGERYTSYLIGLITSLSVESLLQLRVLQWLSRRSNIHTQDDKCRKISPRIASFI